VDAGSITVLGLLVVLAGFLAYLILLFVLRRFTYRTWIFHALVAVGASLALGGWALGGSRSSAGIAVALSGIWFAATTRELRLSGSNGLDVRVGDPLPPLTASTTDGEQVTEKDLMATSPAMLVLYRGWWCPSSRAQVDELIRDHEQLSEAGLTVYAGSVDAPAEAAPLQELVGDRITILCDVPTAFLDAIGVCDRRGAPWYDRFLYGAERGEISMPAALVIDGAGRIVYAYRSRRIDERAQPAAIAASLRAPADP
jgi:peroxiredoxin